jgi:hypothetical protein
LGKKRNWKRRMTEPTTNRWLQTRVPGKFGILLSVLGAFVAGVPLSVFIGGGNMPVPGLRRAALRGRWLVIRSVGDKAAPRVGQLEIGAAPSTAR